MQTKNRNYDTIMLDLSIERVDEEINVAGDFMIIPQITGNVNIKFENAANDPLNLIVLKKFEVRFNRFYVSNSAQPNKTVFIVIGRDCSFKADTMVRPDTSAPIMMNGGQVYTQNIDSTNEFIAISPTNLVLSSLTIVNRHPNNGVFLLGFGQTGIFRLLAGESLTLQNANIQFILIKSITANQHANIELIGTQN